MYGSTSIYKLPSCTTYAGAVQIWERASVPRNKNDWPDGTRPLDDVRKRHYAVIKDGNNVFFRLYGTNVVVWHGPTTITLDSSYDSSSTREFAKLYLPFRDPFVRYGDNGYVLRFGDEMFLRGIHKFERVGGSDNWVVYDGYTKTKPTKQLLDPRIEKSVKMQLAPMVTWIKGLWAISGDDGSHPWVNQPYEDSGLNGYIPLAEIAAGRQDVWERVVRAGLRTNSMYYRATGAEELIRSIREAAYKQEGAYKTVPYDTKKGDLR